MVRIDTPEPPETIAGFSAPVGPAGEKVAVKVTSSANPLVEVTVMVDELELPCGTVKTAGFASRLKSDGGCEATVTPRVVEFDRFPLVPVTVTL